MRIGHLVLAGGIVLLSGRMAAAQTILIGGTYDCSGSKWIMERCDDAFCQVQALNPYAPDGKGAHLEIYRSSIAAQFAQCSVSGGAPIPADPKTADPKTARPTAASAQGKPAAVAAAPAARPAAAPVNPAYIAGAGAGVSMAGAAGKGGPAQRLVTAPYHCTAFIGVPPNGHMATMPGFTLLAGGRYRHQDGSTGTISTSGGTLEFHGGALDGQAATFDAGAGGRGAVRLYNQSRSRTVIDCDGG